MLLFKKCVAFFFIFISGISYAQHTFHTNLLHLHCCDPKTNDEQKIYVHLQQWLPVIGPATFDIAPPETGYDYYFSAHCDSSTVTLELLGHDSTHVCLRKKYFYMNDSDLYRACAQFYDECSVQLWGFKSVFSYPVAFLSYKPDDRLYAINIAPIDGSYEYCVQQGPNPYMSIRWSEDGQYLAFVKIFENGSSVFLFHLPSREIYTLAQDGFYTSPCFSSEENILYFVEMDALGSRLQAMNWKTKERKTLFVAKDYLFDLSLSYKHNHLLCSAMLHSEKIRVYDFDIKNIKMRPFIYSDEDMFSAILSKKNHSIFFSALEPDTSLLIRHSYVDHMNHFVSIASEIQEISVANEENFLLFEKLDLKKQKEEIIFKSLIHFQETPLYSDRNYSLYAPVMSPVPLYLSESWLKESIVILSESATIKSDALSS